MAEGVFAAGQHPDEQRDAVKLLTLAADDRSAGLARSYARAAVAEWHLGEDIEGDVLLVVSELVTNARRHGPEQVTDFEIRLRIDHVPGVLAIGVEDPHPGEPVVLQPSLHKTSGRGMALVTAHCDEWMVLPTADGKQICAFWNLPRPPAYGTGWCHGSVSLAG